MNERMARMEATMESVKESIQRIEESLNKHILWEDNKYKEMSDRFSGKWVEKLAIGLTISFVGAVIGVVLMLLTR